MKVKKKEISFFVLAILLAGITCPLCIVSMVCLFGKLEPTAKIELKLPEHAHVYPLKVEWDGTFTVSSMRS